MKSLPKRYRIEFFAKIVERSVLSYDKFPDIEFTASEPVPSGVHPVDYLRLRIGEEIRRHASQVTIETKNPITTAGEITA